MEHHDTRARRRLDPADACESCEVRRASTTIAGILVHEAGGRRPFRACEPCRRRLRTPSEKFADALEADDFPAPRTKEDLPRWPANHPR